MKNDKAEFDRFSDSYERLLDDPIRHRFSPGGAHFFHVAKRDLIRDYFRRRRADTHKLAYLDLGCGKGELASLLRDDFARVTGCDPSAGMLNAGDLVSKGIETRVQDDPNRIPFDASTFDFVTAVCVFHHVLPADRGRLVEEARRVLKPGGTFAIIEHNPYNPVTRLIVSRAPVDAGAILLRPVETRRLLGNAGFAIDDQRHFLYLPEFFPARRPIERALAGIPLGGQYAVFGRAA